ncbi:alcohol dehydrogenase catalytic domain-containing protein, partial [Acidocella sp. KAb 2-4]|uniref:alcohol dehydrogenase catalytic domain-containing protein n=1 Tax=Acidocella sp. KAb 2-4 TaxID=2885158 RepID=UPI001D08A2CB
LIRVCRCGICASDLHMTSGGPMDVPAGTVLGHEYAGEVVEAGQDGWLRAGDRVTALPLSACGHCPACLAGQPLHCPAFRPMAGGFGQYTLVDQRFAMRLPDSLSFADGALVEPLAAALRGIRKLEPLAGARVAVIGAGAIGASAIFWLRRLGAGRLASITRSRRAEALVAEMGADALLTTGDDLPSRLAAVLGGPPDIVVEGAGAPGLLQQALDLIRPGGSILSLGGCTTPDPILPALAMWKEARFLFSVAYGTSEFQQALATLEAGATAPRGMIGETISLSELPSRFEALRHGSHAAKIMVDPQR